MPQSDETYMRLALDLAKQAAARDEVPVGAVIVKQGKVIGQGYNLREAAKSPLKHAELIAIEDASRLLDSWRLIDCELFVTLEPCLMCAGAIYQSRIKRVIFGAFDPKAGAMGSLYEIHKDERLNHLVEVVSGVEAEECQRILKDFFKQKRIPKNNSPKS